ncbi:transposase [Paenibacillus sp. TRM 82003]|nr:transposase [Paenibacillus sp. TRM 82003]
MSERSIIQFFFQRRWPDGFVCPRCGHRDYYVISSRSLPLYQCKLCSRQTSVTSGTLMDKTRTSLQKWRAAIELLSSTEGVNATKLANSIGVTHKVAWTMLRKFREAIRETEEATRLNGDVYAGVWALAPKYIWMFLPDRFYRRERVVALFTSVDRAGHAQLKIRAISTKELEPGMKRLNDGGRRRLREEIVASGSHSNLAWLNKAQMARSSLLKRFEEVRRWLNEVFHGVGTKHLSLYLSEFCFRHNVAARQESLREAWYRLCFLPGISHQVGACYFAA